MKKTLLLLEVCGIQDYVFSSNNLAQNLGASALVEQSCGPWLESVLKELKLSTNFSWDPSNGAQYEKSSNPNEWDAEVINAGSGNAAVLIGTHELASQVVTRITKKAINEARGLRLVAVHQDFDWDRDILSFVHHQARTALAKQKESANWSLPQPGLSVTANCAYTGQPAVGWQVDPDLVGKDTSERILKRNETPKRISREVADKIRAEAAGRQRLHDLLPFVKENGMEFVYDFDDFGVKGQSSYMAVIHTDGNHMGDRFEAIRKQFQTAEENPEYVNQIRCLSVSIQLKARVTLRKTGEMLFASLDKNKFGREVLVSRQQDGIPILPFRPLIFGGDDATFVCEGRLGLSLASFYIRELGFGKVSDKEITTRETVILGDRAKLIRDGLLSDGQPLYARAGVAIVKNHYPFSRAYDLSVQLCASARKAIGGLVTLNEKDACVLDWHIAHTGIILPLDDLRTREYMDANKIHSLLMRPIRIAPVVPAERVWRTWDSFRSLAYTFKFQEEWADRKNKLYDLRKALRQNSKAVELFCKKYDISELPKIQARPDMTHQGWQGGECGYYDAIEVLDFFVQLERME